MPEVKYSFQGNVKVCAHDVRFNFSGTIKPDQDTDELKTLLTEEAETRAKTCIVEDYVEGELNYETDDLQLSGWWTIKKEPLYDYQTVSVKTPVKAKPSNKKMKYNLSRDAALFLMVETRNINGVQPATLGSAYDSFMQADTEVLLSWCGYNKNYQKQFSNRFERELGLELRRLIRKHGRKALLENIIGR